MVYGTPIYHFMMQKEHVFSLNQYCRYRILSVIAKAEFVKLNCMTFIGLNDRHLHLTAYHQRLLLPHWQVEAYHSHLPVPH